jgi:N-acetylmuramoyl-L-alanine amidase CwlA
MVAAIVFALVWEAAGMVSLPQNGVGQGDNGGGAYLRGVNVQSKIDELEWVTADYLPINEFSRPGTSLGRVNSIVIHYIGNPGTTALQNRNYFASLSESGETHASSNFIVGLDGGIIQCVPVSEIAYASNHRNADTLSIEVCHPDDTGRFSDEAYESAIRLTAWLCVQFEIGADEIIRHYDVSGKDCPRYFAQNEEAWEAFQNDVAAAMEDL